MIYVLNRQEMVVGVLNNDTPFSCPYYDDLHTENVQTGVNTYEFKVPANHSTANLIEIDGYVIRPDLDGKLQMFQVKDIQEIAAASSFDIELYCEHVAIPELIGNIIRPIEFKGMAIDEILKVILQGTGWTLGQYDFQGMLDVSIDSYMTALEAIYKVIETFEAEIEFEIFFTNGQVTGRQIRVTEKRGRNTYKRFAYAKDLGDVRRTENSEGVVTALIGIGKGDTDAKRLTLAGSTYAYLPAGYESDHSADWIGSDDALQLFGNNGKHVFGVYSSDTAENVTTLYRETLAELKRRVKPVLTYEMDIATLERISGYDAEAVRIGDTIIADDYTFTPVLMVEARIIELQRSYTDPEKDKILLGDYVPIKISSYDSIKKLQEKIKESEAKWNSSTIKVEVLSTNGLMFKNGEYSTTLEAKVYDGKTDVTHEIPEQHFIWTRKSKDYASDVTWNQRYSGGRKQITVTNEEIYARATFFCSIQDY